MPDTNNLDVGIRVQEKFEFYFLSLTFVILGLSIQTAEFGTYVVSDVLELLAWGCLFASGLCGLSRMRWVPSLYSVKHEIIRREQYRDEAKRRASVGQTHVLEGEKEKPIEDFIGDVSEGVKDVQDQLSKLETKNNIKHRIHTYAFALGFLLLIGARGYAPIGNLINVILKK